MLPTYFKLGPYRVRVTRPAHIDGAEGEYSRNGLNCLIRVKRHLEPEDAVDVFLHECAHLINDVVLGNPNDSETEANALGSAMHVVFLALSKDYADL